MAHLRLPFGRLWGYDVTVGEPGHRLPVSFDQARHVGAGTRPGSWMALSFTLPTPTSREVLALAWLDVVARHETLRSVFTPPLTADAPPDLRVMDVGPGQWREHLVGPGEAVNDALRDVLDAACSPYSAPSHRLCVLENVEGTTVVVGADHAHTDMWSMLIVVRDLLASVEARAAGRTPDLPGAAAFAEHTRALASLPGAPESVHERWAEILGAGDGVMPRFPMPLGAVDRPQPERVEVRDVLDVAQAARLGERAADEGVSTLSLVISALTAVTQRLAGTGLRVVFPVHSRTQPQWHDSVGWFITNAVLESTDPDPRACAGAVREAVELGSWPLADILAPWGGMPTAPGMFALSWLDLRRLPVRVDSRALGAQYVGARILTDGVMVWFVLDETGLHLRCRYPDTMEGRANVGAWLDDVVLALRRIGAAPAPATTLRIDRADLGSGALFRFLSEHLADMAEHSPAESVHALDLAALRHPRIRLWSGELDGDLVATVALSALDETHEELKSMRTAPERRSAGLGRAMLEHALDDARRRGVTRISLETGTPDAFAPARRLYASYGFTECAPFGSYEPDPWSVFMTREL